MAKFAEVIECLKNGGTASRQAWDVNGNMEVMMQVPQRIGKDIVPKMTSVQEHIKPKISTVGSGEIEYHDQVIIITFVDDGQTPARATYYVPTWEDIFADDWRLSEPAEAYKHRMAAESEQLHERIGKLNQFFRSPLFESLTLEKRTLMKRQRDSLAVQLQVLKKAIGRTKDNPIFQQELTDQVSDLVADYMERGVEFSDDHSLDLDFNIEIDNKHYGVLLQVTETEKED